MKSLLGLTLALVAIGATGAHAQACPERVTSQVERALGPETAWLADDKASIDPSICGSLGNQSLMS